METLNAPRGRDDSARCGMLLLRLCYSSREEVSAKAASAIMYSVFLQISYDRETNAAENLVKFSVIGTRERKIKWNFKHAVPAINIIERTYIGLHPIK